jgi:hypothetical protein
VVIESGLGEGGGGGGGGGGVAATAIVNVTYPDCPPEPPDVNTLTCAVPAVAMSRALMDACNWVEEMYAVLRELPFQRTTDPMVNLDPVAVRIKLPPPAVAVVGDIEFRMGNTLVFF